MSKKEKKDELSSTSAVAPVTVPLGQEPNHDELEDEDESIKNIKENIKKIKKYVQ